MYVLIKTYLMIYCRVLNFREFCECPSIHENKGHEIYCVCMKPECQT